MAKYVHVCNDTDDAITRVTFTTFCVLLSSCTVCIADFKNLVISTSSFTHAVTFETCVMLCMNVCLWRVTIGFCVYAEF